MFSILTGPLKLCLQTVYVYKKDSLHSFFPFFLFFNSANLEIFHDFMSSAYFNPFMPNVFSILINWTSPFPILGLLGGIFHFYSNFKCNFCKQTVKNLIRRGILQRLIWFCTVYRCPTEWMLALHGLIKIILLKIPSAIPSECQTVWTQIRSDILSGLIWI